jgi:predicted  nucleic acid-binding Zn-ribbon protein
MKTRDEYVKGLKNQLDRWNDDMSKWEAQAKAAQADMKKRYEKDLESLRAQREKALYNLKLLESASATAWSDFTAGADEAWERMREAIAKSRTHFEKRP